MSNNTNFLARWLQAREMALAGYITQIIRVETGLTYKQVRRMYKELEEDGYKLTRKSRTARGGATLIHSHTSKIEASLLMELYISIAGQTALRSIDLNSLHKAFQIYNAVRNEMPDMKGPRWQQLDITDAWCLAQELRSGDAMIENCSDCGCNYFTSVNQRTSVDCPYCKTSLVKTESRRRMDLCIG